MIKLKNLIKEELLSEGKVKHGFDLTDFKHNKFPVVLRNLGIGSKAKWMGNKGYYWQGKDILIVTGNNPINGKFYNPKMRKDEKNYASYIGVEGSPEMVEKAVGLIKKYASYIKGESKGSRRYI